MMNIELLSSRLHLSTWQIAQELGCSQTNVRHWLKKYGLTTQRTRGNTDAGFKVCTSCKQTKPLGEFYANGGRSHSNCKPCLNKKTVLRQRSFKAECIAYKGGKCEACGYDKCAGALEFHHRDPSEKDFAIADWKAKSFTEPVREELDKCALLCANCHREVHCGVLDLDA